MNESFQKKFPLLRRKINGKICHLLDGPAGTQVPEEVIRSISQYYRRSNANKHGAFITAKETDKLMSQTRSEVAVFLGAAGGHNISYGQNMTSLNYSLARAFGRKLQKGDEILITQLDHEANRGPWLSLRPEGIIVKEIGLNEDGTLDYDDFESKLNDRTRLVCIGWASNITGSINSIRKARNLSHRVGAQLLVDAVHYAPHFKINVEEEDIDFLLCSAYKFYGPHVGILYAKTGLLDQLPTDRLRTTDQHAPYSIETGTLNHAAIAGVRGAIRFLASIGSGSSLRAQLDSAFNAISSHENQLGKKLYQGLLKMPDIKVIGPSFEEHRAPTISFIHHKFKAAELCQHLAKENIFAWDGHFYAIRASEILGLHRYGGVTRMGISAYTDVEDIKRTLEVLNSLS